MNKLQQIQLENWWHSPLGRTVLSYEQGMIASLSSPLDGYFQLQVGGTTSILPQTHRQVSQLLLGGNGKVKGAPEALPFKSHSIDNLLLVHVLEHTDDPHQVLREIERVLAADGKLILCSFNPFSLWGGRRLLSRRQAAPWDGRLFTQARIKDWLALLSFDVIEQHKTLYRPPFKGEKCLYNSRFIEHWGQRLWPCLGAVTITVATKRTIPLNPLRHNWRQRQLFPTPRLINKPITRNKNNGPC